MRPILAFAILLLALSSAAPEPDYSAYFNDYFLAAGPGGPSLIEIESSIGRTDRLTIPRMLPHMTRVEIFRKEDVFASTDTNPNIAESAVANISSNRDGVASLAELCTALYTSAQNNGLPVPFFANLIWQESRLHADDVSKKGAQGIAQFMPETAAETGLDDPFDPMQAIPASARFLRELRMEFGNLGFVAAAYNAGARRVVDWLEHRGRLPRETRGYVMRVTGLSVDDWRKMAVDDDALAFVQHLPCRNLPAFANVEQAHAEQVQAEQAKLEQLKLEQQTEIKRQAAEPKSHGRQHRAAERERARDTHETREARREARHAAHARHAVGHGKHRSA